MDNLRELYQQVILDHNKNPKNFGKIEPHNHQAQGDNPLCGDHLDVYLFIEGDTVTNISFEGNGCAIAKASASLMTTMVKGKSVQQTRELLKKFQKLVMTEVDEAEAVGLGKLAVFAGVREFPVRIKCATLAWHTAIAAIDKQEVVTTE